MRRLFRVESWKYVIAFLVPVIFVMMMNHTLDNDSWGVLAEGRYIVENGIYYEDVLSMHEGLHEVVQNYAFAVPFYLIHFAFGPAGIYITMLVLLLIMLYLLYRICMLISEKNVDLSLILTAVTGVALGIGFIVTRAQMIDYVVFAALIYVLELYIKTDKMKYLWWIPVFSLVLINFHASVWWIIFAIMVTYIIDSVKGPKILHLQGYRTKPLILMALVAIGAGFLNPYGVEMMTSIFGGYGGLVKLNLVSELRAFNPMGGGNLAFYLMMVGVLVLYIYGKTKNVRVRYLMLFFGFLMMGMSSIKGLSELLLTMFFPLALVYKDWKMPKLLDKEKIGNVKISEAVLMWVGVVVLCVTVGLMVYVPGRVENRPSEAMEQALDVIDEGVGNSDKRELRVYAGYNTGGYVEYRGYRAYLDPRGAEFLESVNRKEGILEEWMDLDSGKMMVGDFLAKREFDYLVVGRREEKLYNLDDKKYELIYNGGNLEDGSEIRVYKKLAS